MLSLRSRIDGRAHPRAPFGENVRYFEWDRARLAHASQISEGGLFLRTQAPLGEGRLLTIRVELPGERAGFTALCRVVRTVRGSELREAGMGLKFVDISPAAQTLIRGYVNGRKAA